MEFSSVEKTKDSVKIRIKDANMTLITPLLNKLSEDENVTNVRYVEKHPELEDPVLMVSVKKGKPEEAIKRAAERISEYFSDLAVKK
ncbi:MAG: DNA-directed RNA polymerase subunit L [Methanomassiliicoccaceae archaeon]|nr:DNA-directed RNA polymerase subunit L [Methanomassiliicoccaceae archaeon]